MSVLVADASALVSLGVVAGDEPDLLERLFGRYTVVIPKRVIEELQEIASYDDIHGGAATAVLDRREAFDTRGASLDNGFPLDDGENAAVTLANGIGAAVFLCDEFTHLGLIHASLANTRVVTTPTLLSVYVRRGDLTVVEARELLGEIAGARSWEGKSSVDRARSMLEAE